MLSIYSPKLIIIKILMKIASEINEQSCIFELFVWKNGKEQMSIGCVVIHLFVHLCLNQATVHIFASKARIPIATPTLLDFAPLLRILKM